MAYSFGSIIFSRLQKLKEISTVTQPDIALSSGSNKDVNQWKMCAPFWLNRYGRIKDIRLLLSRISKNHEGKLKKFVRTRKVELFNKSESILFASCLLHSKASILNDHLDYHKNYERYRF